MRILRANPKIQKTTVKHNAQQQFFSLIGHTLASLLVEIELKAPSKALMVRLMWMGNHLK
jgi:hypothetical protein